MRLYRILQLSFFDCCPFTRTLPRPVDVLTSVFTLISRSTWNQRGNCSPICYILVAPLLLALLVFALISFASSSIVQRPVARVATAFNCVSVTGSTFVSSPSATGGGKPTETSGDADFLTACCCGKRLFRARLLPRCDIVPLCPSRAHCQKSQAVPRHPGRQHARVLKQSSCNCDSLELTLRNVDDASFAAVFLWVPACPVHHFCQLLRGAACCLGQCCFSHFLNLDKTH
jgi:hypothetical protein